MTNNMYFESCPTSRLELISIAKDCKTVWKIEELFFPIIKIYDDLMDAKKLFYLVVEDSDPIFKDENELAYYSYNENLVYIKESVWMEAEQNIGRSRFTLTHELCHYLLIRVLGFGYKEVQKEPVKYKDPDWQADFLAGALLMDFDKTEGMSVSELIDLCKVSEEAAIVHISASKSLKK